MLEILLKNEAQTVLLPVMKIYKGDYNVNWKELMMVNTSIDKKGNRITVLLVDDQPLVRKGLEMRLSLEGDIQIIGEAGDGCQALKIASQLNPQVVIMDYLMPDMDGIQATGALTQYYPEISVILLSIEENPGLKARALEAGAKAVVSKRLGTEKLLYEIRLAAAK
jgi:DNA-binding NarL/FixJ family response regulator